MATFFPALRISAARDFSFRRKSGPARAEHRMCDEAILRLERCPDFLLLQVYWKIEVRDTAVAESCSTCQVGHSLHGPDP